MNYSAKYKIFTITILIMLLGNFLSFSFVLNSLKLATSIKLTLAWTGLHVSSSKLSLANFLLWSKILGQIFQFFSK